ncbi:CPBP family intramembrane glutamic endopeptidase [Candidatus Lokiarchaeum ossiferum]|uniref:CPBP family intramembrane glutamic endopeptidase n=1 Tax=Candidatus Lokiarchaeum ossiferum TaxID=2951803 RepID=UPI00352DF288
MTIQLPETDNSHVPARELLLLAIPVCLIFAVSGMDFVGYFINKLAAADPYSRSLLNVLLGFLFTTLALVVLPIIVIKKRWQKPLSYFGTKPGNKKWGIIICLAFILATPIFYFSSNDANLINTYPLTKDALSSWGFFVFYELLYVVFYYIPYEFFFRGVLQLGLSKTWKKWQSILFVTVLTTFLHLTKPFTEIIAAAFAGILFGIIAEKTDSWYYVFLLHITVGILTDTFCGMRFLGVI